MNVFIQVIAAVCFSLGAADYFLNNRFGIGVKFLNGIKMIGMLFFSIAGIYSLSLLIGEWVLKVFEPVSRVTEMDISIFPAIVLSSDLGGYKVAAEIAKSVDMGQFSGVLIASTYGTAFSFTLPVAMGSIKDADRNVFMKGLMYGLISLPAGVLAGGLVQGINVIKLLLMCIPLIGFSAVIGILSVVNEALTGKIFSFIQKIILFISILGIVLQGVCSILSLSPVKGLVPLSESAILSVKLGIFLSGIFVFIHIIETFFSKPLYLAGKKLGLHRLTPILMLGNLVNNMVAFDFFNELPEKDKIYIAALSVSISFVLGGQLGFVLTVSPEMALPFVVTKVIAGFVSILICIVMLKKK